MAIIACNAVSPAAEPVALAEVEEHLHALPACITGMVSLGVWVGATIALAATKLRSDDTVDLHEADPGFLPPPLSLPRRIASLVADFGVAGDAIIATVNMDHILHSALDEE